MGGRREGGEIGGKKGGRRKERGRGERSRDGRTEGRTEGVKGEVRTKEWKGRSRKEGEERGEKGKTVVESIINHNILKIGPLNISSQNTYTCTCSMCYVKELDNSNMKEVGVTMKESTSCYYCIIPNNSYTPLFWQKMVIFVI